MLTLRMFGDLALVRRGGGGQGGLLVCMVPRLMGVRIDGGTGRCTLMFAVWPTQESVNEGSPEAVPRTPWPGYGIQPVSGPLTPCTACSVP